MITMITVDHCWEGTQVAGRVPRTAALPLLGTSSHHCYCHVGFGEVKMIIQSPPH